MMSRNKMFTIGDRVKRTSCFYNSKADFCDRMIENIGTIIGIRRRYKQITYIVQFDGKSFTNALEYRYTASNLEPLRPRVMHETIVN